MKRLRSLLWCVKGAFLLVCIAVAVLWVRSYWRGDELTHASVSESDGWGFVEWRSIESERGWMWLWRTGQSQRTPDAIEVWRRIVRDMGRKPGWNVESRPAHPDPLINFKDDSGWGPVRWDKGGTNDGMFGHHYFHLRTPHWLLALLCGAWPITSLALAARRALRRRLRMRAGLCEYCGYDLRATPELDGSLVARCPECGRERSVD